MKLAKNQFLIFSSGVVNGCIFDGAVKIVKEVVLDVNTESGLMSPQGVKNQLIKLGQGQAVEKVFINAAENEEVQIPLKAGTLVEIEWGHGVGTNGGILKLDLTDKEITALINRAYNKYSYNISEFLESAVLHYGPEGFSQS